MTIHVENQTASESKNLRRFGRGLSSRSSGKFRFCNLPTARFVLPQLLLYVLFVAIPITFLLENHEEILLEKNDLSRLTFNFLLVAMVTLLISFWIPIRTGGVRFLHSLIATALVIALVFPNQTGGLDGLRDGDVFAFSVDSLWQYGKFSFVFLLFYIFFDKHRGNILTLVWLLLLVSLGQIVYLVYVLNGSNETTMSLADLSANRNVIMIGLDSIQGDVVEEVFNNNPELREPFTGFKFYPNTASVAPNTERSNFITLLGRVPPIEKGVLTKQWIAQYSGEILPHILTEKLGYEATTYNSILCNSGHENWGCYGQGEFFNQYGEYAEDMEKREIYLYGMMRVIPAHMAQAIYKVIFERDHSEDKSDFMRASEDIGKHKFGRGYFEMQAFIEHLNVSKKPPTFMFHHYMFTHQPASFSSECGYQSSDTVMQGRDAMRAEVQCGLKMIGDVINKLKEIGAYENSLIFFISDHGFESNMNKEPVNKGDFIYAGDMVNYQGYSSISRYNPMLFYKDFSANGKLETVEDNVSLVDIFPTICEKEGIEGDCDVLGLEGVALGGMIQERVKKILMYIGGTENMKQYFTHLDLFKVESYEGDVRKGLQALFRSTFPNTYIYTALDLQHEVGTLRGEFIEVTSETAKKGFLSYGPYISLQAGEYQITIGYNALLEDGDKQLGHWDVVGDGDKPGETRKIFSQGAIFSSNGRSLTVIEKFKIEKPTNNVEFRVFYNGKGSLQLHNIKVDKIQ